MSQSNYINNYFSPKMTISLKKELTQNGLSVQNVNTECPLFKHTTKIKQY